jgi:hypothetical protein
MLFLVSIYLSVSLSVLPYLTLCVLCLSSITHLAATATAAPLPLFCPSLLSSFSLSVSLSKSVLSLLLLVYLLLAVASAASAACLSIISLQTLLLYYYNTHDVHTLLLRE